VGPGADRGMVFQDYTSFDHRTVLENITFGLECQGARRAAREKLGREWIEHVGLNVDSDAEKYPHELSGGMRQRASLIRTLAYDPQVVLMDEPFGALDAQTRMSLQAELIRIWAARRKTIVFVSL
jgi:NitT/TauT family transport system ATP-binding protein